MNPEFNLGDTLIPLFNCPEADSQCHAYDGLTLNVTILCDQLNSSTYLWADSNCRAQDGQILNVSFISSQFETVCLVLTLTLNVMLLMMLIYAYLGKVVPLP